jgi:hypothetical protein
MKGGQRKPNAMSLCPTLPDGVAESWLPVAGFEHRYEVSDQGRIRNSDGLIMRLYILPAGYLHIPLRKDGAYKDFLVHRLVATAFLKPVEGKSNVNHKDGIKAHNYQSNLEWVTHAENASHAALNGLTSSGERHSEIMKRRDLRGDKNPSRLHPERMARGSNNGASKLTEEQVAQIKRRYTNGETQTSITKDFNVSRPMIGYIVRGQWWKHIEAA